MRIAALLASLWLALGLLPVAHAEPFALDLRFGPGVEECFTRDQLIAATTERLAQRTTPAPTPTPTLSIQLQVDDAGGASWRASFTSQRRDSPERGVREIEVARGCPGLLDAMSLVLVLIVAQAESEASAAPPPPPPIAPRRPPIPRPPAPPVSPVPAAFGVAAGIAFGFVPEPMPLLALSGRVPLPLRPSGTALPLFVEVGADVFLPTGTTREGEVIRDGEVISFIQGSPTGFPLQRKLSAAGAGVEGHIGAQFTQSPVSLEPVAGLWLHALQVGGAGADADVIKRVSFTLTGWDVGCAVQVRIARHWSLFALGQVMVPFELQTMRLGVVGPALTPASDVLTDIVGTPEVGSDGNPFDNSTSKPLEAQAPLPPGETFVYHRMAQMAAMVRIGIAFVL